MNAIIHRFENTLHQIFELGIAIKALNSIWELFSGFFILFAGRELLNRIFNFLAYRELLEDPNDFVLGVISPLLQNLSHGAQMFIAFYLLFHGILNLFLAIQLYRERIWAYLANISVTIIFIFYQIHRIYLFHSVLLTIITVFDVLFIILTWHEYKYKKLKMV